MAFRDQFDGFADIGPMRPRSQRRGRESRSLLCRSILATGMRRPSSWAMPRHRNGWSAGPSPVVWQASSPPLVTPASRSRP